MKKGKFIHLAVRSLGEIFSTDDTKFHLIRFKKTWKKCQVNRKKIHRSLRLYGCRVNSETGNLPANKSYWERADGSEALKVQSEEGVPVLLHPVPSVIPGRTVFIPAVNVETSEPWISNLLVILSPLFSLPTNTNKQGSKQKPSES